jgi:hypothetical protein
MSGCTRFAFLCRLALAWCVRIAIPFLLASNFTVFGFAGGSEARAQVLMNQHSRPREDPRFRALPVAVFNEGEMF